MQRKWTEGRSRGVWQAEHLESWKTWEMWGDMGRYGEMRGDLGRCGELWGDLGRSGEILVQAEHLESWKTG